MLILNQFSVYAIDCNSKSINKTEKIICNQNKLIELDRQLSAYYNDALFVPEKSKQNKIKKEQKSWLKNRNKCTTDSLCIQNSYIDRIRQFGKEPRIFTKDTSNSIFGHYLELIEIARTDLTYKVGSSEEVPSEHVYNELKLESLNENKLKFTVSFFFQNHSDCSFSGVAEKKDSSYLFKKMIGDKEKSECIVNILILDNKIKFNANTSDCDEEFCMNHGTINQIEFDLQSKIKLE